MKKFTYTPLTDGLKTMATHNTLVSTTQVGTLDANNYVVNSLEDRLQAIESQVGIGLPEDFVTRFTTLETQVQDLIDGGGVTPTPTPDEGGDTPSPAPSGGGSSPDPVGSDDENNKLTTVYAVRGTSTDYIRDYSNITKADYENNKSNIITIRWNADYNASYYKVYRKVYTNSQYTYQLLATNIKTLNYADDSTKSPNTQYQYAVSYVNASGVESAKEDSNRILTPALSSITPCGVFGDVTVVYNQTKSSADVSTETVGNIMHYYVIRDGQVVGRASAQGSSVKLSDTTIVSGKTYIYKILVVTNAGLWMISEDFQITIPDNTIQLDIKVQGEAKIGDDYYLFNNRTYQYTLYARAVSSNVNELERINKFEVNRYNIDSKTISANIYQESTTSRVGSQVYVNTYPGDFANITVTAKADSNAIIAATKRYKNVDPILYAWALDDDNEIVTDNSIYSSNGELVTEDITVNNDKLKDIFEKAIAVNSVTDREIDGKYFGYFCNALYRNLPGLRLFIFVPKSNEVKDRYYSFRLIDPDDGKEIYNSVPFFGFKGNDIIYDELIETSYGTVSSEYRVYISMIKYDDVKGGMCDGKFQVVGHAYETA